MNHKTSPWIGLFILKLENRWPSTPVKSNEAFSFYPQITLQLIIQGINNFIILCEVQYLA